MGMFQPSWTYSARRPTYIPSKTPAAGISMAVVSAYYSMIGDDAMQFLRQSTASQVCLIGPLAKSSDGTAQTGQTIANTDIKIRTNAATSFANKNSGGATEIANGSYYATFDATDTATVGRFDVSVALASTLVWERSYMVLPGIIYDSFFPAASGDPLPAFGIIDWGTAQASAAGTLVHRSGLSLADDIPNGSTELIYSGTGAGQARATYDFTGSSDTSNVSPNWTTTPDTSSLYATFASPPASTNASALPTTLLSEGTGTGQVTLSSGTVAVTATSVRTAVGMSSANLDTQLTTIDDFLDTEIAAIKTKTDFLPSATAGAAGGLFIAGSNAATTVATWTVSGATVHTGNFSMAAGLNITQSTSNTSALVVTGNGTGNGATITSGSGATGQGVNISSAATNGSALVCTAAGTGTGFSASGGASGIGARFIAGATGTAGAAFIGGSTSGSAATFTTTSGDAVQMIATAGNGLTVTANGTSKHGALITGGTAGTSDGLKLVAGTGGLDLRGDITKNAMTESYPADGAAPTVAQALMLIMQTVGEVSVSGTTLTVKGLDGVTAAATYSLDSAVTPTSRTRAT